MSWYDPFAAAILDTYHLSRNLLQRGLAFLLSASFNKSHLCNQWCICLEHWITLTQHPVSNKLPLNVSMYKEAGIACSLVLNLSPKRLQLMYWTLSLCCSARELLLFSCQFCSIFWSLVVHTLLNRQVHCIWILHLVSGTGLNPGMFI